MQFQQLPLHGHVYTILRNGRYIQYYYDRMFETEMSGTKALGLCYVHLVYQFTLLSAFIHFHWKLTLNKVYLILSYLILSYLKK